MGIQYFVFTPPDIERYRNEMISLMEMVLADNITQNYSSDLSNQYVDKMPGYITDGSAIIVGAISEEILIGFSWAYELSIFGERRIHIDMIGVAPDYRTQGIARKLVNMQLEEAKKRDVYIIEAMTTKANENSYRWFHSMGFVDERVKVKLEIRND